MEMQESGVISDMLCDEVHSVEGEEEEISDVEENKMGGISSEGLPILVHIESFEGGPILAHFLQKEIIGRVVNGCVQEFPLSVDTLNEFRCVIFMPKEIVASVVVQDLQRMTHWGGIHANIQCTIASRNKIKTIVEDRERVKLNREQLLLHR